MQQFQWHDDDDDPKNRKKVKERRKGEIIEDDFVFTKSSKSLSTFVTLTTTFVSFSNRCMMSASHFQPIYPRNSTKREECIPTVDVITINFQSSILAINRALNSLQNIILEKRCVLSDKCIGFSHAGACIDWDGW